MKKCLRGRWVDLASFDYSTVIRINRFIYVYVYQFRAYGLLRATRAFSH